MFNTDEASPETQSREQFKRLKAEFEALQIQKAAISEQLDLLTASGKFDTNLEMTPELASALERTKENAALYSRSQFQSEENKPATRAGVRSRRGMIRL